MYRHQVRSRTRARTRRFCDTLRQSMAGDNLGPELRSGSECPTCNSNNRVYYCDKCEVPLCAECWETRHKPSAKSSSIHTCRPYDTYKKIPFGNYVGPLVEPILVSPYHEGDCRCGQRPQCGVRAVIQPAGCVRITLQLCGRSDAPDHVSTR